MKKMTQTSLRSKQANQTKLGKQAYAWKVPSMKSKCWVDKENTHQRLPIAGLKVETESFTTVAQEQSRLIRNYQAKIIKNGADSMSALW